LDANLLLEKDSFREMIALLHEAVKAAIGKQYYIQVISQTVVNGNFYESLTLNDEMICKPLCEKIQANNSECSAHDCKQCEKYLQKTSDKDYVFRLLIQGFLRVINHAIGEHQNIEFLEDEYQNAIDLAEFKFSRAGASVVKAVISEADPADNFAKNDEIVKREFAFGCLRQQCPRRHAAHNMQSLNDASENKLASSVIADEADNAETETYKLEIKAIKAFLDKYGDYRRKPWGQAEAAPSLLPNGYLRAQS
jgi:hypothetical protein